VGTKIDMKNNPNSATFGYKGKNEKYDLLDVYFFKDLVKNRFFKPVVNFFLFIFLLIIIYFGLSSVPDLRFHGGIPFATTMIWDLWHPLLAFTLILVGRLWLFCLPHRSDRRMDSVLFQPEQEIS